MCIYIYARARFDYVKQSCQLGIRGIMAKSAALGEGAEKGQMKIHTRR